ncbi:glycosyltransferase [Homoserinibacter gongjuensis]|uniref:glycosyltransferase n=1 Tax=Homoserinibacter gongjuensis TaxID=1162968 RepID=UPI0024E08DCD|nr:glycosyltransferase [Homoserinibacter gongjuensis]
MAGPNPRRPRQPDAPSRRARRRRRAHHELHARGPRTCRGDAGGHRHGRHLRRRHRPGVAGRAPAEGAQEWLWLLRADSAPAPDALEALLAAVEVAPSVAVAGPKLVDPDDHARLRSFGVTMSGLGATVALVDDELDQAQYDSVTDVLAVAVDGAIVRRGVWQTVDGLDSGLPSADAGLDLGVRVRLAGHRVVRVPAARVERARRPEDVARKRPASARVRRRIARTAQLHRRFVYAPALAVPLHWLSLLPLALLRSIVQLLAKRPGAVPGEISAAFRAAFDGSVPGRARG